MPTNLFTYATTDISYVNNVSSTLDTPEIQLPAINEDANADDSINSNLSESLVDILGVEVSEEDTYSLVFGAELSNFNIIYKYDKPAEELEEQFKTLNEITSIDMSNAHVVEIIEPEPEVIVEDTENIMLVSEEIIEEPVYEPVITYVDQSEALLEIECPDENYTGAIVTLEAEDRILLERLVMGEAGGEGVEGAALVAQAIRDTMVYKGFNSVEEVRKALKYSGSTKKEPNQDVKDAVAYVFDEGGIVVKHSIFYFYAPKRVESKFHESQKFIIEYGGHRFFSNN